MAHDLAAADIFQDLPEQARKRLAARGRYRSFAAGEQLFRKGEINNALYLIKNGRVQVQWSHPDLAKPVAALELGPGDEYGALGVLDGEPRRETVTAIEPTETVELSASALAAVLFEIPPPDPGLPSLLSRRIRSPDELQALARATGPPSGEPGRRAPPAEGRAPPRNRAGPAP